MHVTKASEAKVNDSPWLIEQLWLEKGVGLIGGEPKMRKSFLACNIAAGVATGKKVLGFLPVQWAGPVLYLAGEDSAGEVKKRLDAACPGASDQVFVSTDLIRLDTTSGIEDLIQAASDIEPALIVIDPLVRFNRSGEHLSVIQELFAGLRAISTELQCSVCVVHHLRKGGSSFRGSGELQAWGESNLYMRPGLRLEVELRTAPSWGCNLEMSDGALRVRTKVEKKIKLLPLRPDELGLKSPARDAMRWDAERKRLSGG